MKLIASVVACLVLSTSALPAYASARRSAKDIKPATRGTEKPGLETLPVRRVTLYSNGVAYVERRGMVTGHAEVSLPFKQSQVDDALKSMVVLDLGKGAIGAVSFASSEPSAVRLSEVPFAVAPHTADNGAVGGLAGVLQQLQGARVTISAGTRSATGSILTVEQRIQQLDASKPAVTTRTVVVASDDGAVESFDLDEVRSVRLVDADARRNVAAFAEATADARKRDSNTIVVTTDGQGTRELVVGYTVAAPVWTTTYRVVLDDEGKPFFQGWAVVHNVSDEDWSDVSVSLASGSPVSFVQSLQHPLYKYRPVVPPPSDVALTPQGYSGPAAVGAVPASQLQQLSLNGRNYAQMALMVPGVSPAQQMRAGAGGGGAGESGLAASGLNMQVNGSRFVGPVSAPADSPSLVGPSLSESTGVTAAASGEQVGDLFEYRVDQPVTLARNRSALIPIVQTRLEGARVSVFNTSIRSERPLSALRLRNSSDLTLEAGPMTIFDGDTYVGEAAIDRLKPGEERFIPFSLDFGTQVSLKEEAGSGPVFLVTASKGTVTARYYAISKKTFTIKNQTPNKRVVYFEHPINSDWELTEDSAKPVETTSRVRRFRVEMEPNSEQKLVIAERLESVDTFYATQLTSETLAVFSARGYVDDASKAALAGIVEIRTKIAKLEESLEANEEEVEKIKEDQERLRENIDSLKDTAEARSLIARYIAKADAQETRLEQLDAERTKAEAEKRRLEAELGIAAERVTFKREIHQ
jgi:hypothetical protein